MPNKPHYAQSPTPQLPVHVLPGSPGPRALLSRPSASVSPRSPSHLARDSGDVLGRVSESEKNNTSLTPALTGAAAITRRHVTGRAPGRTLHPSREEPDGAGGLRARLEASRPLTKLIWGFCSFLFSAWLQPPEKVDAAPAPALPSLPTEACSPSPTHHFSFLLTQGVSLQGQCSPGKVLIIARLWG